VFERFRGRDRYADDEHGDVATRRVARDDRVEPDDRTAVRGRTDRTAAATGRREVRARQRERFGGTNWGAAFFGWLVTVGMGAILTALAAAAGAAIGLTEGVDAVTGDVKTLSLVGAILLLAIVLIAYFTGGYVSGRMSRFDGGRQGLGVWLVGLLVTIVLGVLGAIAGSEYNVLAQLNLPRIPVDEGDLTFGAVVALVLVVVGTLLAAMAGGKAGERYHRRVDRYGFAD
jgi:hypothetical protein